MSLKVGELFAELKLDKSSFDDGLVSAGGAMAAAGSRFDSITSKMTRVGGIMSAAITLPVLGAGAAMLSAAGNMEQWRIGFTTLLGSSQAATTFLKQLKDFAKNTPFEMPGLVDAARKLLAFGFRAEDVIPILTRVGNAVSAMGGRPEQLEAVTRAIGQIQTKGKVSAEEMNQLAEAGIPAWEMLAQAIGVTKAQAMKLGEEGKISAEIGIGALMSGMGRYNGAMEAESKTLLGMLSNLKDEFVNQLAEVGADLLPLGKALIGLAISGLSVLGNVAKAFTALPGPIQGVVLVLGGLLAAAGPVLLVAAQLVTAWRTVSTVLAIARLGFLATWAAALLPALPVIAVVGAIIAVLTLAAVVIVKYWQPIRGFFEWLWGGIKSAFAWGRDHIVDILSVFNPAFLIVKYWQPIVGFFRGLWDAVYDVTIGRLGRVFGWIGDKLRAVGGFFKGLYDRVVGHSYVPDLVAGVRRSFEELGGPAMVIPVRSAMQQTEQAFAGARGPNAQAPMTSPAPGRTEDILRLILDELRASNRVAVTA